MFKLKNYIAPALIAFTLIAAGCNTKNETGTAEEQIPAEVVNNPATAQENATGEEAVPVFSFEKDNHDFGKIMQGEKVTYTFKFKNTGNAPLVISSASASCGCTVPEYTKTPVQPGEEGTVAVTFDSAGKSGITTKNVTLIANTIPNTKVLTVTTDIQVPSQNN